MLMCIFKTVNLLQPQSLYLVCSLFPLQQTPLPKIDDLSISTPHSARRCELVDLLFLAKVLRIWTLVFNIKKEKKVSITQRFGGAPVVTLRTETGIQGSERG